MKRRTFTNRRKLWHPLLGDPQRAFKKAAFAHGAYFPDRLGIKTPEYTLISQPDGSVELYDHIRDPKNTANNADEKPDLTRRLLEQLKAGWRTAAPASSVPA